MAAANAVPFGPDARSRRLSLLLWTSVSVAAMNPAPVTVSFEKALFADQPGVVEGAANDVEPAQDAGTDAADRAIVPPPLVRTLPPTAGRGGATPSNDIVVTGRSRGTAPDPFRSVNETSFKATQAVDDAITGPVARAYKKTAPKEFRKGVHNFLYNLREPVVFVNFVLQHKIGKAAETVARFAINTTAGVAGLFDIAKRKPFKLPRRSNGFANTLGFYGVPNGPFMFLPLVGPTTVRDLFGGAIDRLILPVVYGSDITRTEVVVPLGVLGVLDHRSEFDDTLRTLHKESADPYASARTFYLQRRQAEIDALKRGSALVGGMSEAPAGVDETGRPVRSGEPVVPAPSRNGGEAVPAPKPQADTPVVPSPGVRPESTSATDEPQRNLQPAG
jgi:phospholipid-binding lipoprotein MlaA